MILKDVLQVIGDKVTVCTGETVTKIKQDGTVKEKVEEAICRLC